MTLFARTLALALLLTGTSVVLAFDNDPRKNTYVPPPDYKPDPGKPTARVRIVAAHADAVTSALSNSDTCSLDELARLPLLWGTRKSIFGTHKPNRRESIGMPAAGMSQDYAFSEHAVTGGQPLSVALRSGGQDMAGHWSCSLPIRFTPVAGADYEVRVSQPPDKPRGCRVTLAQLASDSTGKVVANAIPYERLKCK